MLRELHISNLAVIEDVTIELTSGLNVFTGETGAGKSLVIGAFELLLGLRAAGDMLRTGSEEGRVSGVFELRTADLAADAGRLVDQTFAVGEQILITRKLFASGRTSVSVNGQPATAAMVRQLGELLVDIHGQHDHQFLLKPGNQLLILDAFARCDDLRKQFSAALHQLRTLRDQQEQLTASRTLRRQQLELYEFQAEEIDAADPQPDEFPELQARHTVLSNFARIQKEAGSAHAAIYEAEGSVVERLQMVVHLLNDLAELDERLQPISQQVRESTLSLQEAAFELGRYVDRLDHDPAELGEVEQRLNELNRLVQKYSDSTGATASVANMAGEDLIQPVLDYRAQIGRQIAELRGQDQGLADMDRQIAARQQEIARIGKELTAARRAAASEITPRVEAELKELGMAEAKFDVLFETADPNDDASLNLSGLDAVEFAVQPNPGQAMQPLRRIASGGELSRIMLAIKSILAGSDRISVLVFDEIDANIGGRLGSVIGRKLRGLASQAEPTSVGRPNARTRTKPKLATTGGSGDTSGGGHQILCITHLPQIAAFADRHLRIAKEVVGSGKSKQTRTSVTLLDGNDRIDELAEMMAGKGATQTTRQQAKELLDAAVWPHP